MRPAVLELQWDDQVLKKLWTKHRVQSWDGTMRDISREEAERMWEEATPVEVERRRGGMNTVRSIRMTNELLGELEIAARSRGKGPTTLAHELIEQGLALGPSAAVPLLAKVASRLAEEMARMARGRSPAAAKKATSRARRRAG